MIRDFTGRAKDKHRSAEIEQLFTDLTAGKRKLTRDEKDSWTERVRHSEGVYKLMGWAYDFRFFMGKYVVKTDHYLEEVYAFDKTSARKAFKGLGRVRYIVEVVKPLGS